MYRTGAFTTKIHNMLKSTKLKRKGIRTPGFSRKSMFIRIIESYYTEFFEIANSVLLSNL